MAKVSPWLVVPSGGGHGAGGPTRGCAQHLQQDGLPHKVTAMEFHLQARDLGSCRDEITDELQGFGKVQPGGSWGEEHQLRWG